MKTAASNLDKKQLNALKREKQLEEKQRKHEEAKSVIFTLSPDDLYTQLLDGSNKVLILGSAKPKTLTILFEKLREHIKLHTLAESIKQMSVAMLIMQNNQDLLDTITKEYQTCGLNMRLLLILYMYRPTFDVKLGKLQQIINTLLVILENATYSEAITRLKHLNLQKPISTPSMEPEEKATILQLMGLLINNSTDTKFVTFCFSILKDIGGLEYIRDLVCNRIDTHDKFTTLEEHASGHYMRRLTHKYRGDQRMFELVQSFNPKEDRKSRKPCESKRDFVVHAYVSDKNIALKSEYMPNCNRLTTLKDQNKQEVVYDLIKTSVTDTWQERLNAYTDNTLPTVSLIELKYSEVNKFCTEHKGKFISIQSSLENKVDIIKRPRNVKRTFNLVGAVDSDDDDESTSSKSSRQSL